VTHNFGDFQNLVYAEAVKGKTSRYPFDFASIQRKASEALPDWVYRYVSAAAGDGRTQRANIEAYSHYGILPRMMVSPPERDLSVELFGKHLPSPIFMCPIGLIGLCAPDFQGDVAAAQASAATGVPFTLSTFSQSPMEDVITHAGDTPNFYQLYLPADRELAASLINRAERCGYAGLVVTVDSWTLGFRPTDLEIGNFPQFRGYCMQNYYSDENFTKHLAKPPQEDQAAALAHYTKIFANPLSWEDLRWIRSQTQLPIAVKGIQHADDARLAIDNGANILYCTTRWTSGEFGNIYTAAATRSGQGRRYHPGDVRLRRAGCHRRHHRARAGCDSCRDRPTLRIRLVLRGRGELDPFLEGVPGRTRSVPGRLRFPGHRRPAASWLRTGPPLIRCESLLNNASQKKRLTRPYFEARSSGRNKALDFD